MPRRPKMLQPRADATGRFSQPASTSNDPISQSPRERAPQRTPGRAPTLTEKVESLEETVAHLTQANEGLLAKVAEQDNTINTLRVEKLEMVRTLKYEIKKAQESSRSRAVQAAQADSACRAGTLSVNLSTCKLASAQRGKKQRVVPDIEDYVQRRFVRSDKPAEDALQYYLLAPRKVALLKYMTIACGLDRVYYLDAKHQIGQEWSAEKVMFLKQECGLSRRGLQKADQLLSWDYDEANNEFKVRVGGCLCMVFNNIITWLWKLVGTKFGYLLALSLNLS